MSTQDLAKLPKPKVHSSRFIENFDFIPPPELLDLIEEGSNISSTHSRDELHDRINRNLIALFNSTSNKPSKIIIADPLIYNHAHVLSSPNLTRGHNISIPHREIRHRSQSNPAILQPSIMADQKIESSATAAEIKEMETFQQLLALKLNHGIPEYVHVVTKDDQVAPQPKPRISRRLLNCANIYIKRYDAWHQFLTQVIGWLDEIVRTTLQSEGMLQAFFKETKWTKGKEENTSTKEVHQLIQGFTIDLAQQEQAFAKMLKGYIPNLEKLKKECTMEIKKIKGRPELSQEELLRKAEVTVHYMSQLTRTCKEARRTIEKGVQLTTDPWLANLYVLRQLKKEVDEENRLRRLMVPIQRNLREYEVRLLVAVEEAMKMCFKLPKLPQEKLNKLHNALNKIKQQNWDAFIESNKKLVVNEQQPEKNYLKINYAFKNDPLVMTLFKGQLERKVGVLNKYTTKFFVLTEAGFLHQFKLNNKVSPEYTIYIPNATVTHVVQNDKDSIMSDKQDSYSFEVQCKGTFRDRTYTFRTFNYNDMMKWYQILEVVASNKRPFSTPLEKNKNVLDVHSVSEHSSPQFSSSFIEGHALDDESTPPPSPLIDDEASTSLFLKPLEPQELLLSSNQYIPQLNI